MTESRIPDFNNGEEEAEFFDTHDFTEFWDEGTPVKPRRIYSQSMQVRLDPRIDAELQEFVNEQSVKKSTLARMWLEQRIRQEHERHAS